MAAFGGGADCFDHVLFVVRAVVVDPAACRVLAVFDALTLWGRHTAVEHPAL